MDKFFIKFDKIFTGPMTALANQRHLQAVRDGMISTIPITIIGSFFLILGNMPVPQEWHTTVPFFMFLREHVQTVVLPFRVTMGLLAVYVAYNTGHSLATSYQLDGKSGGTMSLLAFFMSAQPQAVVTPAGTSLGFALPMNFLGGAGVFVALFSAMVAVEILRFFIVHNFIIKMPDGVPESVGKAFAALFPTAAVVIVMWLIAGVANINLHQMFGLIFTPLKSIVDTPYGAVLLVLLITLLWVAGIHGVSVIGAMARPLWVDMLDSNAQAQAQAAMSGVNAVLPYITPEPFFQWFVWIGGSGGTIGLIIWMLFARSQYLKQLGKVALLPALFNINEPLIFGVPIMLNPFFVVPFVLGPVTVTILTYFVMAANWVSRPYMLAPWTFPAPVGAFLSTGDWRAIILSLVNIVLMALIYLPFVVAYDNKLKREEISGEA